MNTITAVDLFAGIGGFHVAAKNLGVEVVFASEIDKLAASTYEQNYGLKPEGDITAIPSGSIPDHDILMAGFPCQPFSQAGKGLGVNDPRGTLYLEILRIAKDKRPKAIVLENVKMLLAKQHNGVIHEIVNDLEALGYTVDYRLLNLLDLGLPQRRERVIIVATLNHFNAFPWPSKKPMKPLSEVLEDDAIVPESRYVEASLRAKYHAAYTSPFNPSIWTVSRAAKYELAHDIYQESTKGISSKPYSPTLLAQGSWNYILVNGDRKLTARERLRLQGFPDSFKMVASPYNTEWQAGNAIPVPLAQAALEGVLQVLQGTS